MRTNQEIQDMKKDCAKAIGEVTDGSEDVYKGWIEALNWVTMTNKWTCTNCGYEWSEPKNEWVKDGKCELCKLPDGLQKYIDGVGLNILYSNYHKSTNGIWSRAEIDETDGDEWMGQDEYYVVNIDFGCQDDTRNEQYRERMDVWRDKETGEWTCSDSPKEINNKENK